MINLTQHQERRTSLQKEMTLYFQEWAETPPSADPLTLPYKPSNHLKLSNYTHQLVEQCIAWADSVAGGLSFNLQ